MNLLHWLLHWLLGHHYVLLLGEDGANKVMRSSATKLKLIAASSPSDDCFLVLHKNGKVEGDNNFDRWLPLTWGIPPEWGFVYKIEGKIKSAEAKAEYAKAQYITLLDEETAVCALYAIRDLRKFVDHVGSKDESLHDWVLTLIANTTKATRKLERYVGSEEE